MLFYLLGKVVYSADASGEPTVQELPVPDISSGEYGLVFVKMFLTLIALIVLMGLSFWFLRRLVRNRANRSSSQQMIQILEKRMISPKSMLFLVEVEGQKILLAESQHEIRRLQNWPYPTESLHSTNCTDTTDGSFKVP